MVRGLLYKLVKQGSSLLKNRTNVFFFKKKVTQFYKKQNFIWGPSSSNQTMNNTCVEHFVLTKVVRITFEIQITCSFKLKQYIHNLVGLFKR